MKILKKIFLIGMILSSAITFSQEKNETIKLNLTVKDYNNKPVPGAIILLDNVKQDKLEKQQKVGVIFADISGFTSLAENYSPEETKGIINECFNIITEPVYRLDGYIDKYIGDCVMAVFGLENEHDVPLKTVECALTMRDKLNKYIKNIKSIIVLHKCV